MTRVVSFISEKGGVGKTTACFEIAVGLVLRHHKRLLVVDVDYQRGGITGRLDSRLIADFSRGALPGTTLFHKFQQLYSATPMTPDIDVRRSAFNIDFIAADPRLSTITEDKLPSGRGMRERTQHSLRHLMVIDEVLKPLKANYDYILIDSHPEVSSLLRSAIFASDYCVSPVKLDLQSSIGVPTVIAEINGVNDDVKSIQASLGQPTAYTETVFKGAIGMMAREYRKELKISESTEYRRLRGIGHVFKYYVTEGDGIRRAAQNRTSVRYISIANARKQTEQFDDITDEFLTRCP